MIEKYCLKWEPTWPLNFGVAVRSRQQAETLACCLIRVERYLRRRIPKGDFRHLNLADRVSVARRKFQGQAGLVEA
jgi:hypothetical protein